MAILNYHDDTVNFEISTTEISGVVGSNSLEKVFLELVTKRSFYFSSVSLGVISSHQAEPGSTTLQDLIARQFRHHKNVSSKRSSMAVAEILRFLDAEDIADTDISSLAELQRAQAMLARAIALRPEVVLSWNYFSAMTAGVQSEMRTSALRVHEDLGIGFIFFEKKLTAIKPIAQTCINFHPVKMHVERTTPMEMQLPRNKPVKSSPDEISGLDFVSN
ncbi:MAG: hypothetical protein RIS09_1345 [Actinomycetota bacterium]|jgi:ABC-type glutathione transport system ATPase component